MTTCTMPTFGVQTTLLDTRPDDDIDLFDFPPTLDDWARDKKVCQYFDAEDEAEICDTDPEYFIRAAHCWDPGCHDIHTWYYCLRHYAANIGYLAHCLCNLSPDIEITRYIRCGDIPPRYQIIEWGRIGEEGEHELPSVLPQ